MIREPDAIAHLDGSEVALWWRQVPPWRGRKTGYLGRLSFRTVAEGVALLRAAEERLRAEWCEAAIAPIDGSTWQPYRAVIDPGTAPSFALEPITPPHHPAALAQGGFMPCLTYRSALCDVVTRRDPPADVWRDRFTQNGITINALDCDRLSDRLPPIHHLIHAAFAETPLFTPLPYPDFEQQYHALLPYLRPDLIRVALDQGRVVGLVWAFPDWCDRTGNTVVLKTVARWPGWAYGGLGRVLVADCHRVAAQLGYGRIIHGLMRDRNPSQAISRRYAQPHPLRRYALFAKVFDQVQRQDLSFGSS
ncbi:hypothetical protein PN441_11535 [Spirulina major CS-329]|uniref:hypothetical protein n=1 Tax=Spirulina TaxID=1154 RepID=UPI00232D74E5|nr:MULTISPECIES: hypothetical protein [Spirulina]MDB9493945.1 hypothetical protein [Spirulina subsalsa CS-330]MDB9503704.1 hypothetical protein [Spirulina major CS-329]